MPSSPHRSAAATLIVLATLATGCHLIFRYQDDPGATSDLSRLDGTPADGPAVDRPLRDIASPERPVLDLEPGDGAKPDIPPGDGPTQDIASQEGPPPVDLTIVKLDSGPAAKWKVLPPNSYNGILRGVYALSAGSVFAVGDQGKVLHSAGKSGLSWKHLAPSSPTHPNSRLQALGKISNTEVVVVGNDHAMLDCTASACAKTTTFSNSTYLTHSWSDIWCDTKSYCYLAGGYTTANKGYLFLLGPNNWLGICGSKPGSFLGDFLYGVTGHVISGNRYIYAVGLAGRVIRYKSPTACEAIPPPGVVNNLTAAWASPGGHLFVAGINLTSTAGALAHTPNPTSPAPTWQDHGQQINVSLNGIWGTSNSDVWAVGNAGTITHWDGKSWTKQLLPPMSPTPNFHAVHGTGPKDVYVVGTGGTILHFN